MFVLHLVIFTLFSAHAVKMEAPSSSTIKPKGKIYAPIWDKFLPIKAKLSQLGNYINHPNYGGVQLLSPQFLWEKLHEKTGPYNFLTGPKGAIFGFSHPESDYPFAYRKN